MTREEAIERFNGIINAMSISIAQSKFYPSKAELDELCDMAISALQAEQIERISDNTIVVKYADYEDIGRIILTNGDIFCKMFYEDARQNDDSDYDSLVPDEYKTEPSYLISRADVVNEIQRYERHFNTKLESLYVLINELPSAEQVTSKLKKPCDSLLTDDSGECKEQKSKLESADDTFCKSQLITCNRVKECNGVCPFEDALKHADKEMDEQTVIDHNREWIIGCIKHDGFIKTDRFDKANQIILDALADRPTVVHCRECVRKKNCWMFDEHKDDNGTCVWAEPYYITESPNDVVKKNDEVIERPIIEHDKEWIMGCIKHDGFLHTDRFDKANQIILDALADRSTIVRCKDCEYYDEETEVRPSPCPMLFTMYDATPNDFCSWAKMKGGAE